MQVSEEKICKCGHSKIEHTKNPESKLSILDQCKKCQCTDYMNRKLPNKSSVFSLVLGFITIGFFVITGIFIYALGSISWNEPIKMTVGTLVTITLSLFCLISLLVYNSGLLDYFKEKKRKQFPIE